ncbi:MAG: DNA repair protein RecN [Bacilli bacterium]|nr:DNA repair protein RecN [Bacilli bacterium]
MLKQLTIKNFAIIDDLSIEFEEGYNVFTGETGAGKSLIIDAISLLTGERADNSMIKDKSKKAFIEGVFYLNSQEIDKISTNLVLDSNILVVNKELFENKTTLRINNRITTLQTLKQIMKSIIDIHSQHDNLYLLDHKNHLLLLDEYAKDYVSPYLKEYQDLYYLQKSLVKELNEIKKINVDQDELDYLTYQKEEIEKLELEDGEIEHLTNEQNRLKKFEVLQKAYNEIIEDLEDNALGAMYNARHALDTLGKDELFYDDTEALKSFYYDFDDKIQSLKAKYNSLNYNDEKINSIQNRLFDISKIQRKYGRTYGEIMDKYHQIVRQIDTIENASIKISELEKQIALLNDKIITKGQILDKVRKDISKQLIKDVIKELKDLYLVNATFDVIFTPLENFNKNGISTVEFYVSLNAGQSLKPLIKVASGGEVSRLMLGLKVIFNRLFNVSTTIFDEIDTGVSGKVARAMGLKMMDLAKFSQVIVITHLPQVASLGNNHYYIQKITKNNNTSTIVTKLDIDERIEVIASMLSSNEIVNENSYNAAKDLLKYV